MRWKASESDETASVVDAMEKPSMWEWKSRHSQSGVSSAAERYIQEDDSRCCAGRGIVQERQPKEKLGEGDLSRLDIRLSRREQS
ncbi:uncharacterized protein RBU57_015763 isoform 2-T4 [Macrochelys suwanniensis]